MSIVLQPIFLIILSANSNSSNILSSPAYSISDDILLNLSNLFFLFQLIEVDLSLNQIPFSCQFYIVHLELILQELMVY